MNSKYGVSRFHAAHLNFKSYAYRGWDDQRKKTYSAELLDILKAEGKRVHAVSCGIFADEYRRIISEVGRRKMGSPYLVCFNSCIAFIAKSMNIPGAFKDNDCFSVVLDRDEGYRHAIESFLRMKNNPAFEHRSRLCDCNLSTMEDSVCLRAADLIAYEFSSAYIQRETEITLRLDTLFNL